LTINKYWHVPLLAWNWRETFDWILSFYLIEYNPRALMLFGFLRTNAALWQKYIWMHLKFSLKLIKTQIKSDRAESCWADNGFFPYSLQAYPTYSYFMTPVYTFVSFLFLFQGDNPVPDLPFQTLQDNSLMMLPSHSFITLQGSRPFKVLTVITSTALKSDTFKLHRVFSFCFPKTQMLVFCLEKKI
jgi:hypothetical protein